MRRGIKLFFLISILLCSFCLNTSAQYADLVGKWVMIKGPANWEYVGIAYDEGFSDHLIVAYECSDRQYFKNLLESFKVLKIKNYTSAILLDTNIFEGKAKVALLSGPNKGMSGWIPIKWLISNDARPILTSKDQWMLGKFTAPGTDHLWGGYIRRDMIID